jgi:hypothetical protein
VDQKQSLYQYYASEINLHMQLNASFMLHVCNYLFITRVAYICRMIWCSFDSNLWQCYSYGKNNITDFIVNDRKIVTLDIPILMTICYLLRTTFMDAKLSRLRRDVGRTTILMRHLNKITQLSLVSSV